MDRTNDFMSKVFLNNFSINFIKTAVLALCYMMQSLRYDDKIFYDINLILKRMNISSRNDEFLCRIKYLWAD